MKENIGYINHKYPLIMLKGSNQIINYDINLDTTIKKSPYLKINDTTKDLLCVTRYQTVLIDLKVKQILQYIMKKEKIKLCELTQFIDDNEELLRVCNLLLNIDAVTMEKVKVGVI